MDIAITPRLRLRCSPIAGVLRGALMIDGVELLGVVGVAVDFGRPDPGQRLLVGGVTITVTPLGAAALGPALVDALEAEGAEVDVVPIEKLIGEDAPS